MFFCCCPADIQHEEINRKSTIKQKLIENEEAIIKDSLVMNIGSENDNAEVSSKQQPQLVKMYLKSMSGIESNFKSSYKDEKEDRKQQPILEPRTFAKSLDRIGSYEELQNYKNKRDLWQEQSGSKILYLFNRKSEEMVLSFKIKKLKIDQLNALNYVLNPNRYIRKTKTKSQQPSLNLVITSKTLSDLKIVLKSINQFPETKIMFGVLREQNNMELTRCHYESQQIHEVVLIGGNCIRLQYFDKIVISSLCEKQVCKIIQFCKKSTEYFELDDLARIIILFPAFLTLSQINLILSNLFRKFLVSEQLQRAVKYLGFHIELIQSDKCDRVILVKNSLLYCSQQDKVNRQFQTRLELSIGLLQVEIDYSNFKSYRKLMEQFFGDMTILKYFKFVQYLHRERKEFISKLEELKIFQKEEVLEIQNSTRVDIKIINDSEKCLVFKHRSTKKMGQLFTQYQNTRSALEQAQTMMKQWDDDLKESDFQVTKSSKNNKGQMDQSCSIFERIEDSFIEETDLDIIAYIQTF